MRLHDFASFFRRDEFDAMTAAYDAAWQHLRSRKPALTEDQARTSKEEAGANHFGIRLQRHPRCGAAKGDRIARDFWASVPSANDAGAARPSRYPFGHVGRHRSDLFGDRASRCFLASLHKPSSSSLVDGL